MDLDLWLRLRHCHELHYVPECLAQLRYHADAKTWRDNTRALTEAYQVIRRHAHRVGPLQRTLLATGYRAALAQSECQRELRAYFAGGRAEAAAAMGRAIAVWPAIVASRAGARLWLRLLFPLAAKRHIFHAP